MGNLRCAPTCGPDWPVEDGLPRLLESTPGWGLEGFVYWIYQVLAPIHDLGVKYGLPIAMLATEDDVRGGLLPQLELDALAAERRDGRPVRILDVGIGGGGNLPWLAWALPKGLDVELWGLDFSSQMLAQCRQRLLAWTGPRVDLLLGDAHALPFADGTFDRVLHVGAIASYHDPARALAEMSRVARPGTPVVVVDEQLAAGADWYRYLMFHWITMFDHVKRAPIEHVPRGVTGLRVTQPTPFYFCMSFRTPA
jgi:SAM-dependent methyltransferase